MYSIEDLELFQKSKYNESSLSSCQAERMSQKNLIPVPDGGNAEGHRH